MSNLSAATPRSATSGSPSKKTSFEDAVRIAHEIRTSLEQQGWFHLREKISLPQYDTLCEYVGHLELRTDVRVDEERFKELRTDNPAARLRPTVYSPAGLDLHTDRPTADFLGWYCVAQDAEDGTLRLLDLWPVLAGLAEETLALLRSVPMRYHLPDALNGEQCLTEPLLSRSAARDKVYFAPWHVEPNLSPAQKEAVEIFEKAVNQQATDASLHVRLEPGESLFVDNRRFLHGRGAIAPKSRRHLVRYYIQLR
jgi:hypothetical protein